MAEVAQPKKERSQATKLVNLMTKNGADLFHAASGQTFASVTIGNHRETLSLTGNMFSEYLAREYFLATHAAPTASALKDARSILVATARTRAEHPVFLRLARVGQTIWLDLGRADCNAVKVTADGWEVVADPAVRFRRNRGMLALPIPERGEKTLTDLLSEVVNIHNVGDLQLLTAWIVGTFRGLPPYPILSINGEHGTAKSTACRTVRRIIDPNTADLRLTPKEPRDLMIMANNSHVLAFDNLSHIPDWLSDALCALATGGGFSTRELHSDNDETLFSAARPILMNGITDVITRADLLDRSLVVTLDPIPDDQRRRESELDAAFATLHPRLLGALLDAVSAALKHEPTTTIDRLPRMADFAIWVTAAEPALGWEAGGFLKTYFANRQTAVENSLDGDVIVNTILGLSFDDQNVWTGRLQTLLARVPDSKYKPASTRALANVLRRKAGAFRQIGIHVGKTRKSNGDKVIDIRCMVPAELRIAKREPEEEPPF